MKLGDIRKVGIEMQIKSKKRNEIEEKYKWDLQSMYTDQSIWEDDFSKAKKLIEEVKSLKGTLGEGSKEFLKCIETHKELDRLLQNIMTYAHMKKDEDNSNPKSAAMNDRAQTLCTEAESAMAYFVPELLSLSDDKIQKFMGEREELKLYKQYIDNIVRQKDHILLSNEEEIIANTGDMAQAADNVFTMFNNADLKFPSIEISEGNLVEVTHGNFVNLLENPNRDVREKAFNALYSTYLKYQNTLTALTTANVKKDIFYSKVRKYQSSLEAELDDDNVKPEVYENLIKAVNDNLEPMHRYMKLKKKMLGLEELHMYDIYVPLIKEIDMKIDYEKAKQLVCEGLMPLGEDYIDTVKKAYEDGWIDVYENEGKTSGAYSWGTYDSKPFILLNYQDNVDSVFTLAHEMGHSMHSYFSKKSQDYTYANYSIFVAEVASTVNENLLMHYMLNKCTDKKEKLYFINHYLEQFRTTLYRQTMFAEFEKWTHEEIEKGQALSTESLKNKYYELNKTYYGSDMVVDKNIDMEWSRIPHFYNAFYVYKYSTGFSAAVALSKAIIEEGKPAVDRYKEFLKSGSIDYPINLLKKAGVDMTTSKPIEEAIKVFNELLNEMEKLIG